MHLTWPGHAQLFAVAAERTVLMDPWLAEPVFGGAWFRYPPPPWPNVSFIPRPDFVVLSHAHEDHSGPRTLQQLHKCATVVLMRLTLPALKRRVVEAGFTDVLGLEPWETRELSDGLRLTFVPNDKGWDVASMVVEADGGRLPRGGAAARRHRHRLPPLRRRVELPDQLWRPEAVDGGALRPEEG